MLLSMMLPQVNLNIRPREQTATLINGTSNNNFFEIYKRFQVLGRRNDERKGKHHDLIASRVIDSFAKAGENVSTTICFGG